MLATGEDSIKHLLSRGTHREFGYAALVVMLVFYFAGAVWAAGSAIASGLFVPMLLIGSCIGRIAGLMAVDFAAAGGHGSAGCAACPNQAQGSPCLRHRQLQSADASTCGQVTALMAA